jgi:hypothetical protein
MKIEAVLTINQLNRIECADATRATGSVRNAGPEGWDYNSLSGTLIVPLDLVNIDGQPSVKLGQQLRIIITDESDTHG